MAFQLWWAEFLVLRLQPSVSVSPITLPLPGLLRVGMQFSFLCHAASQCTRHCSAGSGTVAPGAQAFPLAAPVLMDIDKGICAASAEYIICGGETNFKAAGRSVKKQGTKQAVNQHDVSCWGSPCTSIDPQGNWHLQEVLWDDLPLGI